MQRAPSKSGFCLRPIAADLAVEARGATQEDIFRETARGLFSVMCEPNSLEPRQSLPFRAEGENPEDLLIQWLNELIYLSEIHCFFGCDVHISRLEEKRIEGELLGEPGDRSRHALGLEVKGVALHRLSLDQTPEGWRAYVILDV